MDISQLLSQIRSGEGQSIEFKTSFAEEDAAIKSLCAFAHAEGGSVFFGISNDGKVVGVSVGNNTIENFANKLRSSTQPSLNTTIKVVEIENKTIVIVNIVKAKEDSLYYAFNTPYIRIGKSNHVMTPNDIKERLFKGFQGERSIMNNSLSAKKTDPVRIKRIKQNIPTSLIRLTSGKEILNIIRECYASYFNNDELTTQDEVDLIGSFFQSIQDLIDLLPDIEMNDLVHLEFDLTGVIKELEEAGLLVFGGREIRRIEGGEGGPEPFPVVFINVTRKTNPSIISIPDNTKL
jgi:hypothetical protein